MHQTLLATTAALLTACAATSYSASCDSPGSTPCGAGLVDVTVLDRTTGEQLSVYPHEGQRWVAGTPGHRYAVSVRSRWTGRILSVVSVDGVNVVSGETAGWDQRGYVLSPRESFDILGWRKSLDRVADFVFTDLKDSYAARTGRPQDVGVIGVAVFREAVPVPPPASLNDAPSNSARAAPASPAQGQLGTGHGPSELSRILTTTFERAQEHPDQVITIRYDRRESLIAMGVIPGGNGPRPFPGSASAEFVPDPPSRW
ncbi:MAG TPA: hypothetical protein VH183_12630 [Burkholderiaceae bacterium]|jgi:hypothetical protein|nr:hypothetical protein [Burkholderiaceae bacterium]